LLLLQREFRKKLNFAAPTLGQASAAEELS
jgi:hypothetical protein